MFNGDDPLTTYHPDRRRLALTNTRIEGPPGETFSYNKYHPQLLGMILERTTGMSVTEWTQSRLWDPLGMEFDGAWTLDSEASGFEKMAAGLNAQAIDFAKLGRLFLNQGRWDGVQIVSSDWVALATGSIPAIGPPEVPQRATTLSCGGVWHARTDHPTSTPGATTANLSMCRQRTVSSSSGRVSNTVSRRRVGSTVLPSHRIVSRCRVAHNRRTRKFERSPGGGVGSGQRCS